MILASPQLASTESVEEPIAMEDGFTSVREAGRRTEGQRRKAEDLRDKTNVVVRRARGGMESSVRESKIGKDTKNIVVSNRFGNLAEDTIISDIGEEGTNQKNVGKKNRNTLNVLAKEKSVLQAKAVVLGVEQESGGSRLGNRTKKSGHGKGMDNTPSRPKQLNTNRPMRGLVFGPIRGEIDLSSNGKRLRTEKMNIRRPCGVFVSARSGDYVVEGFERTSRDDDPVTQLDSSEGSHRLQLAKCVVPLTGETGEHEE